MATTVPNAFAGQAGEVPADQLDENFAALATAVDEGDEAAKNSAVATVRGDVAENLNTLEKIAESLSIARQESHDAVTSTFEIGDVEEADTAAAEIRGTPTARILDLWLPRGAKGDTGSKGDKGDKGDTGDAGVAGDNGWTAVLSVVTDGEREVQQIIDWTGGAGTKPETGRYVGVTGLVEDVADGKNIRGSAGADGADGADGAQGADGAAGGNFHAAGSWSGLVQYQQYDLTEHGGSSYYALDSNIGSAPPSAHWQLFARKGDTGANGADGTDGADGADGAPGADGADGADGANGLGFGIVPYVANGVVLTDAAGYIIVYFKTDRIEHPELDDWRTRMEASSPALFAGGEVGTLSFTDSEDYVVWRITPDQIDHPQIDRFRDSFARMRVPARSAGWDTVAAMADTVCICIYGQSLSLGYYSKPFRTSAGLPYALRFSGGVRPIDDSLDPVVSYASLEVYRERVNTIRRNTFTPATPIGDPDRGETPGGGALRMWAQLMADEAGVDVSAQRQRILLFAHGQGGQDIPQLSEGSAAPANGVYYQDVMTAFTKGKLLTEAASRSFGVACVFWIEGEEPTQTGVSQATHKSQLMGLQTGMEADVQVITGETIPLPYITYQTGSHPNYSRAVPEVALAQLDLHQTSDRFAMAAPVWCVEHDYANKPHLTALGTLTLGAYFGIAFKRWFYDGVKPKIVDVSSSLRRGKSILLRFNVPGERLVLDDSFTAGAAIQNYGLQVVTSAGAPVTITGVDLVGHDTVRISCATALATGCKVRHAWVGDALRGLGGIRDDQGERIVFDPEGAAIPMHNWAPIFEVIVA